MPEGATMADVRRLDRELLAGEGLDVDRLLGKDGGGEEEAAAEAEAISASQEGRIRALELVGARDPASLEDDG